MNEMHIAVSSNFSLEKIAQYVQEGVVHVILKSFLLQHQALCVCVCVCARARVRACMRERERDINVISMSTGSENQ